MYGKHNIPWFHHQIIRYNRSRPFAPFLSTHPLRFFSTPLQDQKLTNKSLCCFLNINTLIKPMNKNEKAIETRLD